MVSQRVVVVDDDYIVRLGLYGKTIWLHDDMTYHTKYNQVHHTPATTIAVQERKKSFELRAETPLENWRHAINNNNPTIDEHEDDWGGTMQRARDRAGQKSKYEVMN